MLGSMTRRLCPDADERQDRAYLVRLQAGTSAQLHVVLKGGTCLTSEYPMLYVFSLFLPTSALNIFCEIRRCTRNLQYCDFKLCVA